MKKIRMIVSAAVVFAVVSGALAFKPFGAGTVYCFANGDVTSVNSALSCNDTHQPTRTKIDWAKSTNTQDQTTNPCASGKTPFNGAVSGACTQLVPGTDHFAQTAD